MYIYIHFIIFGDFSETHSQKPPS